MPELLDYDVIFCVRCYIYVFLFTMLLHLHSYLDYGIISVLLFKPLCCGFIVLLCLCYSGSNDIISVEFLTRILHVLLNVRTLFCLF